MGFALGLPRAINRRHLARRQQCAQPAISGAILGVSQEGHILDCLYAATDHRGQLRGLRFDMQPDHAGHAVGIGNANRIIAQRPRGHHQIDRIRCTAQEREAAHQAKLDKRCARWRR